MSDAAKPFFDKITVLADLEKRFHKGEWVKLKFTEDLRDWKSYGGNWNVVDENTVIGENFDDSWQYLSTNAFFKPPYVIELDVESIKSNWRYKHLQAGVIVGRVTSSNTGRTFWADGLRRRAGVGVPKELPEGEDLENRSKKNKLSVYVWDGYYEFLRQWNSDMHK